MTVTKLLDDLLETAFWIDSNGDLHYNFREDSPVAGQDTVLVNELKERIRRKKLNCSDFEK